MQAEVLGMLHPRPIFGAVLILWLGLSEVREGLTLKAQISAPNNKGQKIKNPVNQTASSKATHPTNYVTIITNYVTVTNIVTKTNYVNVRVLSPDAGKVAAESNRIKQNVLEYQLKRAKAGDARALYDVGLRYLTGDGVEKDREKALEYLRQSAKGGELLAQRKLRNLGETVPDPK